MEERWKSENFLCQAFLVKITFCWICTFLGDTCSNFHWRFCQWFLRFVLFFTLCQFTLSKTRYRTTGCSNSWMATDFMNGVGFLQHFDCNYQFRSKKPGLTPILKFEGPNIRTCVFHTSLKPENMVFEHQHLVFANESIKTSLWANRL